MDVRKSVLASAVAVALVLGSVPGTSFAAAAEGAAETGSGSAGAGPWPG